MSLRREKKIKILAIKRQKLMTSLKLNGQTRSQAAEVAPTECINALKQLDWVSRHPDSAQREPGQVLDCLKAIDASLKSCFPAERNRAEAINFMTD